MSLKKKTSQRMLMKKIWDYAIDIKERFVLRKKKDVSIAKRKEGRSA